MIQLPRIALSDYLYDLPDSRIARFPLAERDQSKLLVYQQGHVVHGSFKQLADFLPVSTTLFFNNTKVIPARLLFEKPTGGVIEVFLLNPASKATLGDAMALPSPCDWKCTVGNAKRWPPTVSLTKHFNDLTLTATWSDKSSGIVRFSWTPGEIPFARVVELAGSTPLPPYLKRAAEPSDKERYQTIYSRSEGAVAAPTAGLHFTPEVIESLQSTGVGLEYLTLHVSAGTFLPIKSDDASQHIMHEEEIVVHKHNIISLLAQDRHVVAVGTTAMRTLESLFWYGVKLSQDPAATFVISQEFPYQHAKTHFSRRQALENVLVRMEEVGLDTLVGHTSIYVMPGYRFRVTDGLVTNFHQPGSSLLVLVSAFIGKGWKEVYREALDNGYRFLSYGDSSLLFPLNN